jgi:hypothetical protein
MHDPAQYAAIVIAFGSGLVGWQMRNDFAPLFIANPKQIRIHRFGPRQVDQTIESK